MYKEENEMVKKLLVLVFVLFAFLGTPSFAAEENFSIGSSTLGGSFYIMASALSNLISEKVPSVEATPEATNGPGANLQMIETDQMKIALSSASALYQGRHGLSWADGREFNRARVLLPTHSSFFEMVTLSPEIKTIYDLNGKKVHVAMPGATPDTVMNACIEVLGLELGEKIHVQTGNAIDLMKDGRLDCVLGVYGIPSAIFMDLASSYDMIVVDMSKDDVEKVVEKYPYFGKGVIPAGTYRGQEKDVNTVVFWNFLVADKSVSEETVYKITKAIFENKTDIDAAMANASKEILPQNIVHSTAPLHPGAIKYYREIGVDVPEHLIPKD
jgi:TRAP transporter TAXI family solute receptor